MVKVWAENILGGNKTTHDGQRTTLKAPLELVVLWRAKKEIGTEALFPCQAVLKLSMIIRKDFKRLNGFGWGLVADTNDRKSDVQADLGLHSLQQQQQQQQKKKTWSRMARYG